MCSGACIRFLVFYISAILWIGGCSDVNKNFVKPGIISKKKLNRTYNREVVLKDSILFYFDDAKRELAAIHIRDTDSVLWTKKIGYSNSILGNANNLFVFEFDTVASLRDDTLRTRFFMLDHENGAELFERDFTSLRKKAVDGFSSGKGLFRILWHDSCLYFSTSDGFIKSFDYQKNKINWEVKIDSYLSSDIKVNNNNLFALTNNCNLYSIHIHHGVLNWMKDIDHLSVANSLIVDKGFIYFSNQKGTVYCLDALTAHTVWKKDYDIKTLLAFDDKLIAGSGETFNLINKSNGDILEGAGLMPGFLQYWELNGWFITRDRHSLNFYEKPHLNYKYSIKCSAYGGVIVKDDLLVYPDDYSVIIAQL